MAAQLCFRSVSTNSVEKFPLRIQSTLGDGLSRLKPPFAVSGEGQTRENVIPLQIGEVG
jgi:hypothetical protein